MVSIHPHTSVAHRKTRRDWDEDDIPALGVLKCEDPRLLRGKALALVLEHETRTQKDPT